MGSHLFLLSRGQMAPTHEFGDTLNHTLCVRMVCWVGELKPQMNQCGLASLGGGWVRDSVSTVTNRNTAWGLTKTLNSGLDNTKLERYRVILQASSSPSSAPGSLWVVDSVFSHVFKWLVPCPLHWGEACYTPHGHFKWEELSLREPVLPIMVAFMVSSAPHATLKSDFVVLCFTQGRSQGSETLRHFA